MVLDGEVGCVTQEEGELWAKERSDQILKLLGDLQDQSTCEFVYFLALLLIWWLNPTAVQIWSLAYLSYAEWHC